MLTAKRNHEDMELCPTAQMVVFGTNLRREHVEKWRGCFVVDEMFGFKIFVNSGRRIDTAIYQRSNRAVGSK